MFKKLILFIAMLGFVTQVTPVKAIEVMHVLNPAPTFDQAIVRGEGPILNSYTIPVIDNCMTSFSLTTKQKLGLLGLVMLVGTLQAVHKIYRIAQNEENSVKC